MSGLISRIVFIYPIWDTPEKLTYERMELLVGWYKPYVSNKSKELCLCEVNYSNTRRILLS